MPDSNAYRQFRWYINSIHDDSQRAATISLTTDEVYAQGLDGLITLSAGHVSLAAARLITAGPSLYVSKGIMAGWTQGDAANRGQFISDLGGAHDYEAFADGLLAGGVTGVAYETVQTDDGALPLLAPMSEVAGRMATQIGAHYLERENGGRGVLLGGAPGVAPARVVVIGAGNVGWNAAWIAAGMEAEVVLLDKNLDRLRFVDQIHKGRISTLASNRGTVERAVARADLVIGAVLVPGGRAPVLISEDMVAGMKKRSVIVDVAVDQGGCVETIHETTHEEPIYETHGVVHYAVGNMPGAVPNTSTFALTNATLPYLVQLAAGGVEAAGQDPVLSLGINTHGGHVTHAVVAEALGRDHTPLTEVF